MTRSTNPNWTYTVGELCLSAARELGAVGLGDSLDSEEEGEMVTRLNSMLAKWSVDANLFREATAETIIAAGVGAATLPAEVRDVRAVRYVESSTYQRQLAPWNRDEYYALPNLAQTGTPTAFYFSKQLGGGQLFLWPVNSLDATLVVDYNRTFFFAEGPDQELDIPAEWHEAALYGLASRCAGIFNTVELDPSIVQRCDAQAAASYQKALDADRPDSYYFLYDSPVERPG